MRLHFVLGSVLGLCACTFDSAGIDATSAAPGTSTGAPTTGEPITTSTTSETPTTGPVTTEGSSEGTVGVSTTDLVETTGSTTDEPVSSSSGSSGPPPSCGDGHVDAGEGCDDGNLADDDACTAQCQPAACGDGLVYVGMEECDDGDRDEVACTVACKLPTCSDGARNGVETDVDCGGSGCPNCATGQLCGTDDDCLGNCGGGTCVEFASCLELKMKQPNAMSDVYEIDPDQAGPGEPFAVYCEQTQAGGGWTMIAKVDGRTKTFVYSAPLWTDDKTFNVDPGLNRVETKLRSFFTVPLTELLVGIEAPIAAEGALKLNYVQLAAPASHARALFSGGALVPSALGRAAWKAWVGGGSLQPYCDREGVNVQAQSGTPQNYARVRIGMIGNENGVGDCTTPNSYIGVGGGGTGACLPSAVTTTGNRAGCNADNGDKDVPGLAVLFVR